MSLVWTLGFFSQIVPLWILIQPYFLCFCPFVHHSDCLFHDPFMNFQHYPANHTLWIPLQPISDFFLHHSGSSSLGPFRNSRRCPANHAFVDPPPTHLWNYLGSFLHHSDFQSFGHFLNSRLCPPNHVLLNRPAMVPENLWHSEVHSNRRKNSPIPSGKCPRTNEGRLSFHIPWVLNPVVNSAPAATIITQLIWYNSIILGKVIWSP